MVNGSDMYDWTAQVIAEYLNLVGAELRKAQVFNN